MDDPNSISPLTMAQAMRSRLTGYGPLIIGLAGIILAFMLLGNLQPALALVGFILAIGILAILPLPVVTLTRTVEVPAPITSSDDGAMAAFVDALADPCFVLDRRGMVRYGNVPAARQFPSLQRGKVMTLVLRNPELVAAIEGVVRLGEARSFELHETFPAETWDKVQVSPLHQQGLNWLDDDERQVLVTFQSLTELKRVDAMRTDFIANASHELRTPLASLMGFIDTLLGPAAKDAAGPSS
jgi:two-component system phosphate regulon sensor histidine kinase PhoR